MQVAQFKCVEMLTQLTAARELIHGCVCKLVAGEDATQMISMAKILCCRTAFSMVDECVQLHGGYGHMKESAAGRAFVDSRIACVGGGSDETMKQYLAKPLGC